MCVCVCVRVGGVFPFLPSFLGGWWVGGMVVGLLTDSDVVYVQKLTRLT